LELGGVRELGIAVDCGVVSELFLSIW